MRAAMDVISFKSFHPQLKFFVSLNLDRGCVKIWRKFCFYYYSIRVCYMLYMAPRKLNRIDE